LGKKEGEDPNPVGDAKPMQFVMSTGDWRNLKEQGSQRTREALKRKKKNYSKEANQKNYLGEKGTTKPVKEDTKEKEK